MPFPETLHDAVREGDVGQIARLLDSGADPEQYDSHHRSPLLVAAREGKREAAALLLERGVNVDGRGDSLDITALMAAAGRGDMGMVEMLLDAGAAVNSWPRSGGGALSRAIVNGDEPTTRLLLDRGADPQGNTAAAPNTAPLWAAVALKRLPLLRLLIARGANVNTGDSTYGTPFTIAVTGGDPEIAETLLEAGADPLRPSLVNLPLLAVALRFKNPPMAALLEKHGLSLAANAN